MMVKAWTLKGRKRLPKQDIKDRILDVAEALFARDGYSGTSLRAVTSAAEVNLASVNYHFGSKEALLLAAFDRLAAPVNQERLAVLNQLEAAPDRPSLEQIIEAFLSPALRIVIDLGERGLTATRFLGRVAADPTPAVQQMIATEFHVISERFLAALAAAAPTLDEAELVWRFKLMVGVLVYVQGDEHWKRDLPTDPRPSDVEAVRQRTVTFLAEGFRAGATNPPRKRRK
jgi:AcrR family transcriptional regulator